MIDIEVGEDLRGLDFLAAVAVSGRCPKPVRCEVVDASRGLVRVSAEYQPGSILTIIGRRGAAARATFVFRTKLNRA